MKKFVSGKRDECKGVSGNQFIIANSNKVSSDIMQ